jgi:hypothetical protein
MAFNNLESIVKNQNNGHNSGSSWLSRLKDKAVSAVSYVYDSYKDKRERKSFEEKVRNKYNLSSEKYEKLLEVVESEFESYKGKKSRERILQEELELSKQYRKFLDYIKSRPNNFIAEEIHKKVHELYHRYNGKVSTSRIFNRLKLSYHKVNLGYNPKNKSYEMIVDDKATDIRELASLKASRFVISSNLGYSEEDLKKRRVDNNVLYQIKKKMIHDLDRYTQVFQKELEHFGIHVAYNGVDQVLEDRYHVSEAKHNQNKQVKQLYQGRYEQSRTFDLTPGNKIL